MVDWQERWDNVVGNEVELPDGSKHIVGTCLSCEGMMTGPSSDGYFICGGCACGYDQKGNNVSATEQEQRYARVHARGIGWI